MPNAETMNQIKRTTAVLAMNRRKKREKGRGDTRWNIEGSENHNIASGEQGRKDTDFYARNE